MNLKDKAVKKYYEQSTDYQLPPGELWWFCQFFARNESGDIYQGGKRICIQILFCQPKTAQTWFQANKQAELLVREELKYPDKIPSYKVGLWT